MKRATTATYTMTMCMCTMCTSFCVPFFKKLRKNAED